jgi:hypothetical protein
MSHDNHDFVVNELLKYYRMYDRDPAYQRKILEVWQIEAKQGRAYRKAYDQAARQIIAEKPN